MLKKRIDLDSFNQRILSEIQSNKQKLFLFIATFIFIFLFDLIFIMRPQIKYLRKTSQSIIELKKKLDIFEKEWQEYQQEKFGFRKPKIVRRIISSDELTRFLESLSQLSYKNNVKIMKIYHEEVKNKFPAVVTHLELSCGYHNLGKFLADLENSDTVLEIISLKINRNTQDFLNHNVNLKIKIYVEK